MPALDDTDREILALLAADARRPYSEIGEVVGLSGPAVSDRVSRLEEAGVVEGFTVEIDRSQLRGGTPVLVRVTVPPGETDAVRDQIATAEAVEHVFVTADGDVQFSARVGERRVHGWLEDRLADCAALAYDVTLLDEMQWHPSVAGAEFALTCAECANTVDDEGESARLGGELYHFCCSSCAGRFEERYDRLEEGA